MSEPCPVLRSRSLWVSIGVGLFMIASTAWRVWGENGSAAALRGGAVTLAAYGAMVGALAANESVLEVARACGRELRWSAWRSPSR